MKKLIPILMFLALPVCAQEGATVSETAAVAAEAPADAPSGDGAVVVSEETFKENMVHLFSTSWKGVATTALKVGASVIGWGIAFCLLGAILGLLLFFVLHKLGWINAPWPWYAYVRWLWAVLFIVFLGGGFFGAGMAYGGGRSAAALVDDSDLVQKVVSQVYCAAVMGASEFKAGGAEESVEVARLIGQTQHAPEEAMAAAEQHMDSLVDGLDMPAFLKPVVKHLLELVVEEQLMKGMSAEEQQATMMVFAMIVDQGGSFSGEVFEERPVQARAFALVNVFVGDLEKDVLKWIKSFAASNVWGSILGSLVIPVIALVLFRLIVKFSAPKPAAPTPAEAAGA